MERGDEAEGVGAGDEPAAAVVLEAGEAAKRVGDLRDLVGVAVVVAQGRDLADGVGDGDEAVERVVAVGDGVALGINGAGDEVVGDAAAVDDDETVGFDQAVGQRAGVFSVDRVPA